MGSKVGAACQHMSCTSFLSSAFALPPSCFAVLLYTSYHNISHALILRSFPTGAATMTFADWGTTMLFYAAAVAALRNVCLAGAAIVCSTTCRSAHAIAMLCWFFVDILSMSIADHTRLQIWISSVWSHCLMVSMWLKMPISFGWGHTQTDLWFFYDRVGSTPNLSERKYLL